MSPYISPPTADPWPIDRHKAGHPEGWKIRKETFLKWRKNGRYGPKWPLKIISIGKIWENDENPLELLTGHASTSDREVHARFRRRSSIVHFSSQNRCSFPGKSWTFPRFSHVPGLCVFWTSVA
jgi:hypothetical protein